MKVLYHTNIPAPYKVSFFIELAKHCDLTVSYERETASDRDSSWYQEQDGNYKIKWLNVKPISNDSSVGLDLVRYLHSEKFDIVILGVYHTVTAMLAMQYMYLRKKPFILSSDGGFVKQENPIKNWIKSHFISMASLYLSPGGNTDDYLRYYGAKNKKIVRYPFTSYSSADRLQQTLNKEQIRELRDTLGMKEEKILLAIGQMIPRKGFDILLKAMKYVDNNVGVYFVGGKATKEYQSMIEKAGANRIHFVDFQPKEVIKQYYRAADLFVLPTREDIWGLVVIESLCNGTPVITTTNCNAGLELIGNDDVGKMVTAENVVELSNAINELIEKKQELTKGCLNASEIYDFEHMAECHMLAINSLMCDGETI